MEFLNLIAGSDGVNQEVQLYHHFRANESILPTTESIFSTFTCSQQAQMNFEVNTQTYTEYPDTRLLSA